MENRFNLIDEPWIPVADIGQVSLKEIFSNPQLRALGGNPVQKIALTKLLLAIAQSAATPLDDDEWRQTGWQGMADKCLSYLDKWHDRFYLYGEKPFLQMPAIRAAEIKSLGVLSPEVSTGNTTVLTETQQEQKANNADKAITVIVQMGFGLSGKKTDNSVVLTAGYQGKQNDKGKPASGKAGIAVGHMGLLHSFWLGDSIAHSVWLNLFTSEDIAELVMYPTLGIAPWEQMPTGEDDEIAQALKTSLIGRLLPIGKFCLLADGGLHYTDGIAHAGYLEGKADPTASVDFAQKKPKALWVNPSKRPWRELTSLLQFIEQGKVGGFDTPQLKRTLKRVSRSADQFALWSGGLRVSSNAGEQYASGTDDYVQSEIWLSSHLLGSVFLEYLKHEMAQLEAIQKQLWGAVVRYFRQLSDIDKSGTGKAQPFVANQAEKATGIFWQLCERQAQVLINASDSTEEARLQRLQLRKTFAAYAIQVFDQMCPNDSARQMDAWAQARPNFSKYLKAD
ncbi:type I-E CRISPR-associated protein Cse1/CasA [Dickeya dianthicola]|uniref:type I-E CRISPR-associated protein Cse1/CasA n=1 Tax=Dickeya dianthicola TaxID=204039 RepID=UPI0003A1C113|nr:type I-E CRISPR-associated protein Cse1/CasA [Dickeya dianthicola]ATO34356.1 CRISPR-associated protein, Cse1 family [Dickeya dianthicola RNS04.9]MBT1433276.1 type I-E CRISPR-associated protein Cse1/CasA [Dickeya dianthicola]MCA7002745.1 type I-E CRISPR-associated protein Cse1/CasA [Dickeya dianthicola]MCI4155419.1 type I-E CRISPR-associated protein Cse1/CasA [Dickeya dianthicola]QOL15664.1 type I-E CRISPR-associated protein Cse1/CasA [Dickeya dianthicola]